ncbi:MAG: hypothetical protein ACOYN0_08420, partial [Phycisphaerales bacterium]
DRRPVLSALCDRTLRVPRPRALLASKCLAELRTQTDKLRRRDAYMLLGGCRSIAEIDELIQIAQQEPDPNLQCHAWNAISGAAFDNPRARELLIARMLQYPDDTIAGLIKRLPDKGEEARAFVPALIEVMRTGTQAAPAEAAWKIMLMGPLAIDAAPTLDELANTDPLRRWYFAGAAACARGELADDAAVFASWLKSSDPQLRLTGAHMLSSGELLARGHSVTDQLIAALENPRDDDDPGMEDAMMEAVRMRGRRALRAIPTFEKIAANPGQTPQRIEGIRWMIDYIRKHD